MVRGTGSVGRSATPPEGAPPWPRSSSPSTDTNPSIEEGTTGAELFNGSPSIIALRIGGELRDLSTPLAAGQSVEGVDIASEDGLSILRHSAAHVLAQAVQKINPDAKLGIGPPITDGFYYDFDIAEPFTPESLKALEKEMSRIVKEGQRFVRREITDDDARAEEADEPYKLELIGLKSTADDAAEGASVEVGEGGLTMYDNVAIDAERWSGPTCAAAPTCPPPSSSATASPSPAPPRPTGAAARRTRCCSASTAPPGPPRTSCEPIRSASPRPSVATTADSAASWTCSPSPTRSDRACPSSIPRAPWSAWRWRTIRAVATSRPATPSSPPRTSPRSSCSRPPSIWSGTPTGCTPRCTWTRSATARATSPGRARTTTSSP